MQMLPNAFTLLGAMFAMVASAMSLPRSHKVCETSCPRASPTAPEEFCVPPLCVTNLIPRANGRYAKKFVKQSSFYVTRYRESSVLRAHGAAENQ